jgi:hypothetical protein
VVDKGYSGVEDGADTVKPVTKIAFADDSNENIVNVQSS